MTTPWSLEYDAAGLEATLIGEAHGLTASRYADHAVRLSQALATIVAAHDRQELGFLTCIDAPLDPMLDWAQQQLSSGRFTHQVVLGIGGSSLGAFAILSTIGGQGPGLTTHISENIDPRSFARLLDTLPLTQTLVVIISKSGTTIETMSKFWLLYDRLIEALGEEEAAQHVVAITDPTSGALRALATSRGFHAFEVPPNVGGRFSVLTAVGLVPLALAGYDVRALIDGARHAREQLLAAPAEHNLALRAALDQLLLLERGVPLVVMMPYCDDLMALADWFRQLWAESLGKRVTRDGREVFTGITPLKALGVIDQHSQVQLYMEGPRDKHITFVEVTSLGEEFHVPTREGFPEALHHLQGRGLGAILQAELEGTRYALMGESRQTSTWRLSHICPEVVGAFIMSWSLITAVAGELLQIDAFDQPGVELGKKIAHGLLGHAKHEALAQEYLTRAGATAGSSAPSARLGHGA